MNTADFPDDKDHRLKQTSESGAGATPAKKVEGPDDVLQRQKASGPKKDKWADFEEPSKGRKMICWRCDYRGRAPEQKRSAFDALLGFRVPICPRCKAVNSRPLPVLTRISYYPGFLIFLFAGLSKAFSAFRYVRHDSTGAMTLGGLTAAASLLSISFACVNALAKDRAIRSARKK